MPFEITNEQTRNQFFVQGLRKILNYDGLKDVKVAYNVARVGALLDLHQKEADEVFKKLIKSHGTLSENGTFEIDDANMDDWKKAHAEFLGHTTKVERHKIRIQDVEGVPLTPSEIAALEPVLDGLDRLDD